MLKPILGRENIEVAYQPKKAGNLEVTGFFRIFHKVIFFVSEGL
jgi:hypothetical protein